MRFMSEAKPDEAARSLMLMVSRPLSIVRIERPKVLDELVPNSRTSTVSASAPPATTWLSMLIVTCAPTSSSLKRGRFCTSTIEMLWPLDCVTLTLVRCVLTVVICSVTFSVASVGLIVTLKFSTPVTVALPRTMGPLGVRPSDRVSLPVPPVMLSPGL